MPSGNKVLGWINKWGLAIEIHVMASYLNRVDGLCGTFDNTTSNVIHVQGTNLSVQIPENDVVPVTVLESWRSII